MSTPLLEAVGVCVDFGGVRAVSEVSTSIQRGQVCGLVGPNGSGKTTLLGVISGMVTPSAGTLLLDGRPLKVADSAGAACAGVSRTFQNLRLAPEQTALENVMTGAGIGFRRAGWRGAWVGRAAQAEIRATAQDALERAGIADAADRLPGELPYGHRRRVEIARALAMNPLLMLLDEPAAGMTAPERAELCDVIAAIAADGATLVLVEHDFAMISQACSRVLVLSSGELIADGPPLEVAEDPAVQDAYLGRGRRVQAGEGA